MFCLPKTAWPPTWGPSRPPVILDVRTPEEFAAGHLPDAVNIPVDELRSRLAELPHDRPLVAYCQVGQRGYLAVRLLREAGYRAMNLSGGFKTYQLSARETLSEVSTVRPAGQSLPLPSAISRG